MLNSKYDMNGSRFEDV